MKRRTTISVILVLFALFSFVTAGCNVSIKKSSTVVKSTVIAFDGKVALASLISLTENHLVGMANSLSLAAMTREVQSCKWETMKPLLAKIEESEASSVVWFALPQGSYYTVDKNLTGKNLKDREYFPKVLAGETVVGSLVVSRSTGRNVAVVAVPVTVGGQVMGVLGASVYLDSLTEILMREMALPQDYHFFALTDDFNTPINSTTSHIFNDPTAKGSPSLTAAAQEIVSKKSGVVEYDFDGKHFRITFGLGPITGWHFAIGVKR